MRIIAGAYGSRRLKAVEGLNTRPTTDKVKESIFNMLAGTWKAHEVLDFYGGSGGLAIEAVSRGAESALICESYRPAVQVIRENIQVTREIDKFKLLSGDNYQSLRKYLKKHPQTRFSLIFLDPPYAKAKIGLDIQFLEDLGCLEKEAILVCETDDHVDLGDQIGNFRLKKLKQYGQTVVRIYQRGVDSD